MKKIIIRIVLLAVLAAGAYGGYRYFQQMPQLGRPYQTQAHKSYNFLKLPEQSRFRKLAPHHIKKPLTTCALESYLI